MKRLKAQKEPTVSISTRITKNLNNQIQEVLSQSVYINIADYLRNLIRLDIERRNLIQDQKRQLEKKPMGVAD